MLRVHPDTQALLVQVGGEQRWLSADACEAAGLIEELAETSGQVPVERLRAAWERARPHLPPGQAVRGRPGGVPAVSDRLRSALAELLGLGVLEVTATEVTVLDWDVVDVVLDAYDELPDATTTTTTTTASPIRVIEVSAVTQALLIEVEGQQRWFSADACEVAELIVELIERSDPPADRVRRKRLRRKWDRERPELHHPAAPSPARVVRGAAASSGSEAAIRLRTGLSALKRLGAVRITEDEVIVVDRSVFDVILDEAVLDAVFDEPTIDGRGDSGSGVPRTGE